MFDLQVGLPSGCRQPEGNHGPLRQAQMRRPLTIEVHLWVM